MSGNRYYSKHRSNIPKVIALPLLILYALYKTGEFAVQKIKDHTEFKLFAKSKTIDAMYKALTRLKKKNLIKAKPGSNIFVLTPQGSKEAFLANLHIQRIQYQKPAGWDKKWRLVVFDVPEKSRYQRDYLRDLLKGLGFHALQRSTWITPHPIPDFLLEILWEERLMPYTRIMQVQEINFDKDLRKKFRLDKIVRS